MTTESPAIEVEVVAIDGVPPAAKSARREDIPPQRDWQDWQKWHARLRKLDSRWWPLWVFLGIIAVALFLTVGLVMGILFVIFRVISGIVRTIFG